MIVGFTEGAMPCSAREGTKRQTGSLPTLRISTAACQLNPRLTLHSPVPASDSLVKLRGLKHAIVLLALITRMKLLTAC